MLRIRSLLTILVCAALWVSSFCAREQSNAGAEVAAYYNKQLDTLCEQMQQWQRRARAGADLKTMRKLLLECRIRYKKVSMFTEYFDTRNARLINGPDLLRIEDDTRNDTLFPHGFQHLESLLFARRQAPKELLNEIVIQTEQIARLRHAPDHEYYFTNDRIWTALRLGSFRIISLGITGFDVPLSKNAFPETVSQLQAMREVISFYREEIEAKDAALYARTTKDIDAAIAFAARATDFEHADRLHFVRDFMNPISEDVGAIALRMSYLKKGERQPLNPEAKNLFSRDIFDINFFSPNERYRVTPERVALGKMLFQDKRLSANNSRSCASCHQPQLAFSDGRAKGLHLDGTSALLRNTPTLWNSALQTRQFYDSRALVLETQLESVVHNKEEMGGSLSAAAPELARDTAYVRAFEDAYGNDSKPISGYNIANAIASYIRTLISFNARFDSYMRGADDALNSAEKKGFNLFMGRAKCGTCHYAPLFNGLVPPRYEETESEILGVPENVVRPWKIDPDEGKALHTGVPLHRYAFKTPGLRNVALTAPYMHNGVFKTLEEVIDFYDKGGGAGQGIDLETQTLEQTKLKLSAQEKRDLIAFLHALTDTLQQN